MVFGVGECGVCVGECGVCGLGGGTAVKGGLGWGLCLFDWGWMVGGGEVYGE